MGIVCNRSPPSSEPVVTWTMVTTHYCGRLIISSVKICPIVTMRYSKTQYITQAWYHIKIQVVRSYSKQQLLYHTRPDSVPSLLMPQWHNSSNGRTHQIYICARNLYLPYCHNKSTKSILFNSCYIIRPAIVALTLRHEYCLPDWHYAV